ncbi:MAG: DUF1367 family protein [Candidatus Heimdallarchaeota archaeon]|nr:DUF1367 family protein [Candidatus Heimdallarchaeota archaeon]
MKFHAEIDLQGRIKPLYNSDYDTFKKVKKNTPLRVEVIQQRNYKFHKKIFALINLGYENQDLKAVDMDGVEVPVSFDHYRKLVTLRAGFYDIIQTPKGVVYMPKSISYSNMDNSEFEELFGKVLDVIAEQLDSEPFEIRKQVDDFM